jgi:multicomponent K+:H+ antiporter subunit E
MKRLFPAPPMSAILFVLWLVLSQHVGVATVAMAAILAVVLPLLTFPLRPVPMRVRRPRTAIALLLTVAIDAVVSNLQVARSVWHFRAPPRSAFVRIPLDLADANGLAVLALITTIVPGTIWCELAIDRRTLLLHVFDVDDEAAFVSRYKSRYEQPLREVFE